jgi:hypothetical protein
LKNGTKYLILIDLIKKVFFIPLDLAYSESNPRDKVNKSTSLPSETNDFEIFIVLSTLPPYKGYTASCTIKIFID